MTLSIIEAALVFAAGLLIGMAFFGGLMWTIRGLTRTRHPLALALGSLVMRTTLVVAAILLVCRDEWQRYVVVLAGVFIARLVAVRLWGLPRLPGMKPPKSERE